MTVIEIRAKEKELIREINNDVDLLESALKYVKKLKKNQQKKPCQYSVDELKERLKQGRSDAQNGAFKTSQEMRNKHSL